MLSVFPPANRLIFSNKGIILSTSMKRSDLFFAFVLIPVDVAMIIVAFILAHYFRVDLEVLPVVYDIGLREYLRYSLYLMPAWITLFALNGLYRIRSDRNFANDFFRIFSSSSTAMLILIVAIFLSRLLFFSRLIVVITWVLSILTVAIGRLSVKAIQRYLFRFGIGIRRVVLIGDNAVSESIVHQIATNKTLGYKVSGIVTSELAPSRYGLKSLGTTANLAEIVKQHPIDEIILTETNMKKTDMLNLIQLCGDNNIVFKYIPDVLGLVTKNMSAGLIGTMPVMELLPIPLDGWGRISKRFLDIVIAVIAIIFASPFILFAVAGTVLTSPGPIIYRQKRVGRDGKAFDFYKFRSMYYDKCDLTTAGSKWTTKADEKNRITPFGLFLRKTNIDEIPQFFNVLRGDMSFVGPRPELPKFVEQFQKEIPDYSRRHRVKSGITGWAQVNGLKGDTSIKERVKYDIFYIENWSLWLDFVILVKTIKLIISEIFGGKAEYRRKTTKSEKQRELKSEELGNSES